MAEQGDPYENFKRLYWDDPSGFVRDCIKWKDGEGGIAPYQAEILDALPRHKRVSARGPHGLGKTALAAWAVLWFALTRDGLDWKVPTTASAWRQLEKFLWPDVHKWARRLDWRAIGRRPFDDRELLDLSIKLGSGQAFALASDQHVLIEGAHAEHLLYLFDESKAIGDDTWDAAEGAFSAGNCYWLALSTPGAPSGRFYAIHQRQAGYEDWWVRRVTTQEAIDAGRISADWVERRRTQWGAESAVFKNRVVGDFASSAADTVISLEQVEAANERWLSSVAGEVSVLGADVGRGGDPSVIALRSGDRVDELRQSSSRDLMELAGALAGLLRANPSAIAQIDVIGIGAGVVDRLREDSQFDGRVFAFNASSSSSATDAAGELGFADRRAEAWWALRELLDEGVVALPPDDELTGELTAPLWSVTSSGKIRVQSKDEIKKKLHRSTNKADAVVMAFVAAEDDETSFDGLGTVEDWNTPWR